jgi:hypothetical protein
MKNLYKHCIGLFLLLAFISCSKKEKSNCLLVPAALILPSFNFQVVDKNTGTDLFFSPSPAYSLNDIKIVFKNHENKLDSISPPLKTNTATGSHFMYIIPFSKIADTCYIKIKALKTDTVISTIERVKTECSSNDAVIKVQVNKEAAIINSNKTIIVIKK